MHLAGDSEIFRNSQIVILLADHAIEFLATNTK